MKNIIIATTLLIATATFANDKRSAEIEMLMWKSNDKSFDETTVPEKWQLNSAVIIAKSAYYEYKKAPLINRFNYNQYYHIRMKLQDNVAVETFSEFSFPSNVRNYTSKHSYYVGFKVIKADGTEFVVDLNEAVVIQQNVNRQNYDYKKTAIPNLEKGDIIDYYICEERGINFNGRIQRFNTVIYELYDNYPILKQTLEFNVLRRCYINLITLNGANMPIPKQGVDKTKIH
jgi:hypothetical protein